jgi:hypothetical protein
MKIGIVLLGVLINLTLLAQDWAPIGAEWYYSKPSGDPQGNYVLYTSVKDTLVGNETARKIIKQKSNGELLGYEIMYSNNDSVFYWFNGAYHLLYDFSAVLGDTVLFEFKSIGVQNNDTILEVKGHVINVRTVSSGNSPMLKNLELAIIPIPGLEIRYVWPATFTYTEKVGDESGDNYLIYEIEGPSIPEKPSLRCYSESLFSYKTEFWNVVAQGEPCDLDVVGVFELSGKKRLKLYPNPASFEVYIEVSKEPVDYEILDINGKIINQGAVQYDGRISIPVVPNGLYILRVGDKRSKLNVQQPK